MSWCRMANFLLRRASTHTAQQFNCWRFVQPLTVKKEHRTTLGGTGGLMLKTWFMVVCLNLRLGMLHTRVCVSVGKSVGNRQS